MADKAYITPKVLKWARESASMSIEAAAAKVKVSSDKLKSWESGESQPTIKQAETLAKAYQYLVDNTKNRSIADPWIIAHAINEKACVVTKEEKVTASNSKKIKIPNVCDNMQVRWINDFQLIEELNVHFTCALR